MDGWMVVCWVMKSRDLQFTWKEGQGKICIDREISPATKSQANSQCNRTGSDPIRQLERRVPEHPKEE